MNDEQSEQAARNLMAELGSNLPKFPTASPSTTPLPAQGGATPRTDAQRVFVSSNFHGAIRKTRLFPDDKELVPASVSEQLEQQNAKLVAEVEGLTEKLDFIKGSERILAQCLGAIAQLLGLPDTSCEPPSFKARIERIILAADALAKAAGKAGGLLNYSGLNDSFKVNRDAADTAVSEAADALREWKTLRAALQPSTREGK